MSRLQRTPFQRFIAALAAIGGTFLSQQVLAQVCVNENAPAPLEICVRDSGTPGVWVSQPNGRWNQYFGGYAWGSRIQIGTAGFSTGYFTGTEMAPVSNGLTGSGTVADPYVITTVLTLGSTGVQLTQRFRYVNGDRYITKIWTLENTGSTTHSDLRLFHGGDSYFGGSDSARSWYDEELRMVYVNNWNFTNSGYMAFYANPLTPISRYFSGHYSTGRQQTNNGALNDTSDSAFLDAGYYLQWNREQLRPGDVWRIEAFETWSPPGSLQVLTPADEYSVAGSTVRKTFKVHNLSETTPISITMAASTISGWTLAMPGGNTATLDPLQVIDVPVDVQVPAGAPADSTASIVLDVTDGALNTMWGATRVTVPVIDYSFSTRLLDFGTGVEGESSDLIVTFTNGAHPVSIGQAGASNPLLAPFGIVADACSNSTLAAGATCTITVRFSPGMGADFSDSFGLPVASTVIVNETIAVTGSAVGLIDVSAQAGTGGSIAPSGRRVAPGGFASFTITPDTGYRIASVTGCAGTLDGNLYTTAAVTTACTVAASFEHQVFTVDVNQTNGGSISPSGHPVAYGDSATFTATPSIGYRLASMHGCAGMLAGNVYTTAPVMAACTVEANFERLVYPVGFTQSMGGNVAASGQTATHGDRATFTITPDVGHHLAWVQGCNGSLAGNIYTTAPVTAACTVEVGFERIVLPVAATATAGGSISPAGQGVAYGQSATFTVTPDAGHRLVSVEGCEGTLLDHLYTTSPVTGACTVEARFERLVYPLGITQSTGGTISLSNASLRHGDAAQFIITPAYGYLIESVSGCPGTLNGQTFTTPPLTSACTLSATFVEELSTVTVSGSGAGGGGSTGLLGLGGLLLLAMRRLRRAATLVTAGIALVGGAQAMAQQPGQRLHAGAMAGAATSSESASAMTAALQARGYAVTADVDDQRMAWRIHGGWAINRHLAVEVGYSELGEVSTGYAGSVPVLAVDGLLDAAVRLHPRAANGFDLSVAGRYPLPFANRLSVNARAGLFRWDAERRTSTSDGRGIVQYADGANLLLGAGLGLQVSRRIELSAEWMRHAMGSEHVQMMGMGIRYGW